MAQDKRRNAGLQEHRVVAAAREELHGAIRLTAVGLKAEHPLTVRGVHMGGLRDSGLCDGLGNTDGEAGDGKREDAEKRLRRGTDHGRVAPALYAPTGRGVRHGFENYFPSSDAGFGPSSCTSLCACTANSLSRGVRDGVWL